METESNLSVERTAAFEEFIEDAQKYLRGCQAELEREFRLGHWPRVDGHRRLFEKPLESTGTGRSAQCAFLARLRRNTAGARAA